MGWQFWIDRGGTFTDLVGISPCGEPIVRKVLSEQTNSLGDPAVKAIREILNLKEKDVIPNGIINEVRLGTTVATNTLLEGTGSPVVLFCNRGLGDLLRIGDQHRSNLFSLDIEQPQFIADAVIEIPGRINAEGVEVEVLVVDKKLERETLELCKNSNVSFAVALLNSYKNPQHELYIKEWLMHLGFRTVICSHQVSPLPRLVSRGQTTLVEATVAPVLFDYLHQVTNVLGTSTQFHIMSSSGGLISPKHLLAKDTILSGPAGGMVGAVAVANTLGLSKQPLIGFDMGGTSTDVFYVAADQRDDWQRLSETEVAGQKIMAQRLPIHTVAAGGGSIIYTHGQRLRVGPRSAGANPGPACYRQGGPLTITDANLLLGRIQLETFPAVFGPSANQTLDKSIVKTSFETIAKTFSSTPEKIAEGAITIAIAHMANAIKKVSILCGHDIRKGVLVAFGGAGGQHACRLATHLGMKRILIHPLAGVLSAYGIGIAQQTQLKATNIRESLSQMLLEKIQKKILIGESNAKSLLLENFDSNKTGNRPISTTIARVEIRYKSKDQGLMVKLDLQDDTKSLTEKFESKHSERFGYIPPRNETLFVERLEVEVSIANSTKNKLTSHKEALEVSPPTFTNVHFPDIGWRKVPCYQREQISSRCALEGPALIMESTNSIVLEPGWIATIQHEGSLLIQDQNNNQITIDGIYDINSKQPDPVLLELFHHRFSGIAEKMGERLRQTSRSVNIRERLDFSCAIFNHRGELVANAPHIPVHLGAMGESIGDLLDQIVAGQRNPLQPKETVLSNDPYHGGTHLPDITAITPVFSDAKTPRYFVACRAHHADVGGVTPGSMPPFSRTINDEGLLLRNETFAINGTHDRVDWETRLHQDNFPPRNPSELIADLNAQVAANELGVSELEKLVADVGHEEVSLYMQYLHRNAAIAMQNLIKKLEDSYFSVELDNGARLFVEITIDKINCKAKLDFSRTSPQGEGNFQAPLAVTKAAVLYVFRCLLEDDIPLNAGCFEPLELIVPKGCLLNPIPPAAVVAGNVETSQALCNLLFGALGVLSASQGTMNNLTFGDNKRQYYETVAGGSGAGNGFNGADGVQTHMTNSRITDPEIIEQRYPVQLELFAIRKGSGGQGEWTGGDGLFRKFRFLAPMTVSILSGSRKIAPFGLGGGMAGAPGFNQLELIDGKKKSLKGCESFDVRPGEAVLIATPGGGGYGKLINPKARTIVT